MKLLFTIFFASVLLFVTTDLWAQTPGQIFDFSTGAGSAAVLNPNSDNFISKNGVVFNNSTVDEIDQFEQSDWITVFHLMTEPNSDLQTGSTCGPTEIVDNPTTGQHAAYYRIHDPNSNFGDGDEQLVFRIRLANEPANAAYGYSFLLDTDLKIGSTDPNSKSGNPGFEIEVLYGSGNAGGTIVSNVDGVSAPNQFISLASYPRYERHQRSYALNSNCNGANDDPVFMDFYVDFSDMGITVNTPLRMAFASASSSSSALGGSASDIGGVDDDQYPSDDAMFEAAVLASPSFSFANPPTPTNCFQSYATCTENADSIRVYEYYSVTEKFESGADGWTLNGTTTPATRYNGGPLLGDNYFLGRFAQGQAIQKTFQLNQKSHRITFDFYRLDSWDNENIQIYVGDGTTLLVNYPVVSYNTGFTHTGSSNGYSYSLWAINNAAVNIPYTGAPTFTNWSDQIIRVYIDVPSGLNDLTLKISSTLNSAENDESWGIDNFAIMCTQFDVPNGVSQVEYLVVGGGAGGMADGGGGGGGGEIRTGVLNTANISSLQVIPGRGGRGNAYGAYYPTFSGDYSVIISNGNQLVKANGGEMGGGWSNSFGGAGGTGGFGGVGYAGGTGGSGLYASCPTTATSAAIGSNGNNGITSNFSCGAVTYGGGGAGATGINVTNGIPTLGANGGQGGGGAGANYRLGEDGVSSITGFTQGFDGVDGFGGGGGGGGACDGGTANEIDQRTMGGDGGYGRIILRYVDPNTTPSASITIPDTTICSGSAVTLSTNASNLGYTRINPFTNLNEVYNIPSGVYWYANSTDTFKIQVDSDEDGGGWVMALNYVHLGGTNPALNILTDKTPLLNSAVLGGDESSSPTSWGHIGNALFTKLNPEEVRFYGITSGHSRVMHFKSNSSSMLSYFKTGIGSISGLNNSANYTLLSGHTANLPASTNSYYSNEGDEAMTNFPFWLGGTYHWGIKGQGSRWEVDDFPSNSSRSTVHQIWVRSSVKPNLPRTSNYSYNWSTGDTTQSIQVSPSVTTTYYVTVSNANGSSVDSVTVTVSNPSFAFAQDTIISCGVDSVLVDAGAGWSSYLWSNSATTQTTSVENSGTYTVTVTDANGCTASDSLVVSVIGYTLTSDTAVCASSTFDLRIKGTKNNDHALSFDGNDDYVDLGTVNGISGAYSLEAWVYATSYNFYSRIFDMGTGEARNNIIVNIQDTNGYLQMSQFDNSGGSLGTITTNNKLPLNQWVHVAATYDGNGNAKIYYDGVEQTATVNTTFSNPTVVNRTSSYIGRSNWSTDGYFAGKIDEVRIWNDARTAEEIACNMNKRVNAATGLESSLSFSEGNGPTTKDAVTNANATLSGPVFSTYAPYVHKLDYVWSNGDKCSLINPTISNNSTYYVTITDGIGSCTDSVTVTVNNPTFAFAQDTITSCGASSVTVDAGAGWASYAWSNSATTQTTSITTSGTYTVTVTDANGCTASDSLVVSVINGQILQNDTSLCSGGNYTLTVGTLTNFSALRAWFPFNNNSNDESDYANDLVPNNTSLVADIYGGAYSFNGSNSYLGLANPNGIPSGNEHYTISAWIKPNASGSRGIVGWGSYGSGNRVNAFRLDGTKLKNYWWGNDLISPLIPNLVGSWHHVVASFDGTTRKIYVDNSLVASDQPAGLNATLSNFCIGRTNNNEWFSGLIDNVGIWNEALSTNDINSLFTSPSQSVVNSSQLKFTWSNGDTTSSISVSPLATTKYYVTISDGIGSCVDSVTVTISNPSFAFAQDTITSCGADSVTVDAGAGWASYAWSNSATTQTTSVKTSGTYTVTVTDANGCTASDNVMVSVINGQIVQNDTNLCLGSSLNLSIKNAVSNNAADFTNGDFLRVANLNNFTNSNNITIGTWVKTTGSGVMAIASQSRSPSDANTQFRLLVVNGKLSFWDHNSGVGIHQVTGKGTVNDGQWHHIAFVKNNTVGKFYIDGSLDSTVTLYTKTYGSNDFVIGKEYRDNQYRFVGQMDDFQYWQASLTDAEVQAVYNRTPTQTSSLLLNYKFDNDNSSTIADATSNNNDAVNNSIGFISNSTNSYLWSTASTAPAINVTPTGNTTYYVTTTNGISSCVDSVTVTVSNPTFAFAQDTITSCGADSVTVDAGAGWASYAWSTSTSSATFATTQTTSIKTSGVYTVTITDVNGCSAEDSIIVSVINANIQNSDTTICNGQIIPLSAEKAGIINNHSISFDGNGDYIDLGNSSSIRPTSEISVSAWVYFNSVNSGIRFMSDWHQNTSNDRWIFYFPSQGTLGLEVSNLNEVRTATVTGSVVVGKWYHLVGTYNGSQVELFIDGVSQGTSPLTGTMNPGTAPTVKIGGQVSAGNYHFGKIDEVRIWDRAITASEISTSYSRKVPTTSNGLVGYWNFEEGSGNVTKNLIDNQTATLQGNAVFNSNPSFSSTVSSSTYTYSWSNGDTTSTITVSPTTTTNYIVTISDGIGSCTDSVTVTVNSPSFSFPQDTLKDCSGSTALLDAGVGWASYVWSNSATTQTTSITASGTYTVTVTDANGCTASDDVLVALSPPIVASFAPSAPSGLTAVPSAILNNVPEATGYGVVYELDIPIAANYANNAINYAINNSNVANTNHDRVAYYMQLDGNWIWVSMDDFASGNLQSLGLPRGQTNNVIWDQVVSNMNIYTNKSGVTTGENIATGNIEMWSQCYGTNANSGIGGSSSVYDFDDEYSAGPNCHGSFQVHNHGANQTLFAYNRFPQNSTGELGIGNNSGSHPDWTFQQTANTYTTRKLYILVGNTNASFTTLDCNGDTDGSVSLTATGGTQPFTYLWSNSDTTANLTGLSAGIYTVTITDANSCTTTSSVTITEPAVLAASTVANVNVTCNGLSNGSATASGSGGTSPYTFAWSNSATTASITGLSAGSYTVTVTDANSCTSTSSVTITEPAILTANASNTPVSCNGGSNGSATVSATGGTGPYTFVWSNAATSATASGLVAGTYTVTVSDANNCATTASTTITEPTVLVASSVVDSNATCNGFSNGGATASAIGGTSPYNYVWSNAATTASITGVAAGTYTVTVTDANNCTITSTAIITEPSVLTASTVVDSTINCFGTTSGGATANATGGTSPYTYLWSNSSTSASISGVPEGIYTVTVTDVNGCTNTSTANIIKQSLNYSCSSPIALTNWKVEGQTSNGSWTRFNSDLSVRQGTNSDPTFFVSDSVYFNTAVEGEFGVMTTGDDDMIGFVMGYNSPNSLTSNNQYDFILFDWKQTAQTVSTNGTAPQGARLLKVNGTSSSIGNVFWNASDPIVTTLATNSAIGGWADNTYYQFRAVYSATNIKIYIDNVLIFDVNGSFLPGRFGFYNYSQSDAVYRNFKVPFEAVVNTTAVTCNGLSDGTATVSSTSGTYQTIKWSTGDTSQTISNLAPGNYSVTITNSACCADSVSFAITEPVMLSTSAVINANVSCNGGSDGSATASVTGGTAPYTFVWSNAANTASITGVVAGTYTVTVSDANSCTTTSSVTITEPAVLTASSVVNTNISCNGGSDGSATASAIGGTSPYNYVWSNSLTTASITGLSAGTYTVTVSDANNCTTTASTTITEPTVLVALSVVDSNATCNGFSNGGATASATGGTGPYTFVWSNAATTASITGVAAGAYTVTITDANSCTTTSSVTITEPAVLTASTVVDSTISCNGLSDGGATASAIGGTSPYTYVWSNSATTASITGVSAGTYTVTVTDANLCINTSNVTITEPAVLSATATVNANVSCNGLSDGGATASAIGGTSPYTYVWSNSATTAAITGVTAGSYTVTVTDANSCTTTSSVTITEPSILVASASTTQNVTIFGNNDGSASVNVTGGTPVYNYSWNNGGTGTTITNLSSGTYTVTITDANGCTSISQTTVNEPGSIILSMRLDSNVTCNGGMNGGAGVLVTGGVGAYRFLWSNGNTDSTITGLSAGTYTVTVTDANGGTAVNDTTVTEPAQLVATASIVNNASCGGVNDGAAQVSITGGTLPYSIIWSNSATTTAINNLLAGTYSVTVTDANNCSSITSVAVLNIDTVKPSLQLFSSVTVYLDSLGSATLNVNDVDSASFDNCGIQSITLSDTLFGCTLPSATYNGVTSLNFDGVDDYVSIPNSITQDSNHTISVWVKTTASNSPNIFGWGGSGVNNYGGLSFFGSRLRYYSGNGTPGVLSVNGNSTVADGIWHHVAVTRDGSGTVLIYVDGQLDASGSISKYVNAVSNVSLGSFFANGIYQGHYNGSLDDFNYWSRVLSASDIQELICKGSKGSGLKVSYDFSDGIGSSITTNNGSSSVNGTLVNMDINASWVSFGTPVVTNCTAENATTITIVDASGNRDSVNVKVAVIDSIKPIILTQPLTVYLDANGLATITANDLDNGTTDNCQVASIAIDSANFDCSEVGPNTVVFTAIDVNGNTSITTETVTVIDSMKPIISTQPLSNITVGSDIGQCGAVVSWTLPTASDNCQLDSLVSSHSVGTLFTLGTTTVTYIAYDAAMNTDTMSFTVTVNDTLKPSLQLFSSVTVYLDSLGSATLNVNDVDSASFDNCGIQSITLSDTLFGCTLPSATYNGVTSLNFDGVDDYVSIPNSITQDSNHTISVWVKSTASNSPNIFGWGGSGVNNYGGLSFFGSRLRYYSGNGTPGVLSVNGNSIVADGSWHHVAVTRDGSGTVLIYVDGQLDASGSISKYVNAVSNVSLGSFFANGIYQGHYNGSLDDFNYWSRVLSASDIQELICKGSKGSGLKVSYDFSDGIGSSITTNNGSSSVNGTLVNMDINASWVSFGTPVVTNCTAENATTITIVDASGNRDSVNVKVAVIDSIKPIISTQPLTVYLDANGLATITANDLDNGTSDNCQLDSIFINSTIFDCSDVGSNTITFTATDVSGNTSISTEIVTVVDTIKPILLTQPLTVYLDANGLATITANDLNNGTTDNCQVASLAIDSTTFDHTELGPNNVWFTAIDVNNNVDSMIVIVTVLDTTVPVIAAQPRTIYLDASGQATITAADLDNGTTDNGTLFTIAIDSSSFDCSEVGVNTVNFKAIDASGNRDSVNVLVTVIDSLKPLISTQPITIYLGTNGLANIAAADLDNGTSDNCQLASIAIDSTTFDYTELGPNNVWFTAVDVNSNVDSMIVVVTVLDTTLPILATQPRTVYLDASGQATITASDLDNGTADNGTLFTIAIDSSNFDCSEVGVNTVNFKAIDASGNRDSVNVLVTVIDSLKPFIVTQPITVYLGTNGLATITANDLDNGTSDNCQVASISIDSTTFDVTELGPNNVWFTAIDVNANRDSVIEVVTVLDTIAPMVSNCPSNISVTTALNSCDAVVTWTAPTASDNGQLDSLIGSHVIGSTFPLGTTTITYIAYDQSMNTDTCSFTITVIDSVAPIIANVPSPITVNNDAGQCGAVLSWTLPTASDNCQLDSLVSSHSVGTLFTVGTTTVTYIAYDASMNTDTISFTVTVNDTEKPTIACIADTTICDAVFTYATPTTADNCGVASVVRTAGLASGSTFPAGSTLITYLVRDIHGNVDSCSFTVTRDELPTEATAGVDYNVCSDTVILTGNTPTIGIGLWSSITSGTAILSPSDSASEAVLQRGVNTLVWTISNGVCASSSDTITITYDSEPSRARAGSDQTLCDERSTTMQANVPQTGTGVWSLLSGSGILSNVNNGNATVSGLSDGVNELSWTISNGVCRTSSDTVTLNGADIPLVDAGQDTTIFEDDGYQLSVSTDIPVSDYRWDPVFSLDNAAIQRPFARPTETTTYTVKVTTDLGCEAQDDVTLTVIKDLVIPSAFTPNGDGANDTWEIKNLDQYESHSVVVYDGYGSEVLRTITYEDWDGTYKGNMLSVGSYYYVIELKLGSNNTYKSGAISILR